MISPPSSATRGTDLNLAVIGNCSFNALIDRRGCIVWCCMPRADSDPVFSALLSGLDTASNDVPGVFDIVLEDGITATQHYEDNTAVLNTRLQDGQSQEIEIIDYAPRFLLYGRSFRPTAIARLIRPLKGTPRIKIRLRPMFEFGTGKCEIARGSNHVRYTGANLAVRLTTDAPLTYLLQETWFKLERPIALFFGPDETLAQSVMELVTEFHQKTVAYWRNWVRSLSLPVDWQDAVIRAAITLKLCWFEETGGIIAAMTTSIPEAPNSGRNWDYRYCWLRDAYYVIQALNRLGVVDILESYFGFLRNLPPLPDGKVMQPVYGLGLEQDLTEWTVATLNGYRNMGPVRIGNQAFEHRQHDIYGQVILSMARAFFDRRLLRPMTMADFEQLEILGRKAFDLAQVPDAGIWEMRTISRVNTYSSLMCWAACDRLGRIASHFGENTRANMWQERAMSLQKQLLENAWNPKLNHFTSTFHGKELDGSLLQMAELGIVEIDDPRFTATVTAIERDLRRGHHVFRYIEADDIGVPTTAFTACTFWLIDILNRQGERARARDMFQHVLDARNHVGLLSEDIDPHTSELWGNFPQTYSLVGIINTAMRLSRHWRDVA